MAEKPAAACLSAPEATQGWKAGSAGFTIVGDLRMPYDSNSALPEPIRHVLPPHAQDIYRAAFNNAFMSYANSARREEIAHRVAWAAVKKRYIKQNDHWVARAAAHEVRAWP